MELTYDEAYYLFTRDLLVKSLRDYKLTLDTYQYLDGIMLLTTTSMMQSIKKAALEESTFVYDTVETIEEAADRAAEDGKEVIIAPVGNIPPIELVKRGFWPVMMRDRDYYDYKSYRAVAYGEDGEIHSMLSWVYIPLEAARKDGVETCNGLQLSFRAPDLLYKSGRPKTDMLLYRNASSNRVPLASIADGTWTTETWFTIPVTRYSAGMQRALYYTKGDSSKFCGTFYYLEPESTTFLAYRTVLRSFNKTTALQELTTKIDNKRIVKEIRRVVKEMYNNPNLREHIEGVAPRDLVYLDRYNNPIYDGESLYAVEDDLDQLLCRSAAMVGYDIVILESMVGGFQVVTEVLDTRTRKDSFRSLVYTY